MTYISWSSDFYLLFFALKNILVLLAKPDSSELRCPATALIKLLITFVVIFSIAEHEHHRWNAVVTARFDTIAGCSKSSPFWQLFYNIKWVASWQNQQNGMCAQRRLRSAQADQSLRCPHEESLGPKLPIERTAKTDQTGRMPRLSWDFARAHSHFDGFVMRRLKSVVSQKKSFLNFAQMLNPFIHILKAILW